MVTHHLLVSSKQGSLVLWDVRTGDPVRVVRLGHNHQAVYVKLILQVNEVVLQINPFMLQINCINWITQSIRFTLSIEWFNLPDYPLYFQPFYKSFTIEKVIASVYQSWWMQISLPNLSNLSNSPFIVCRLATVWCVTTVTNSGSSGSL